MVLTPTSVLTVHSKRHRFGFPRTGRKIMPPGLFSPLCGVEKPISLMQEVIFDTASGHHGNQHLLLHYRSTLTGRPCQKVADLGE